VLTGSVVTVGLVDPPFDVDAINAKAI
jgi:hypothetical protein